jgi:hypothetical protein
LSLPRIVAEIGSPTARADFQIVLSAGQSKQESEKLLLNDLHRPFDHTHCPLARFRVYKESDSTLFGLRSEEKAKQRKKEGKKQT